MKLEVTRQMLFALLNIDFDYCHSGHAAWIFNGFPILALDDTAFQFVVKASRMTRKNKFSTNLLFERYGTAGSMSASHCLLYRPIRAA
ncbi:hypothetical protein LGM57_17320 [Burkholderia cepacia]|uniref:hypothetical protein n=1 Tax=Burkholderia cepacia TaxID=292 RepID=UPI001CF37760|nr:hypothetical protein [Burkholderia cepacia]MCA7978088.1 hypothetical protein [Burkholderia cepacia]